MTCAACSTPVYLKQVSFSTHWRYRSEFSRMCPVHVDFIACKIVWLYDKSSWSYFICPRTFWTHLVHVLIDQYFDWIGYATTKGDLCTSFVLILLLVINSSFLTLLYRCFCYKNVLFIGFAREAITSYAFVLQIKTQTTMRSQSLKWFFMPEWRG